MPMVASSVQRPPVSASAHVRRCCDLIIITMTWAAEAPLLVNLSDATEAQLLPDVAITARREPHTSISACCIVLTLIKRRLARPVGSVGDRLPLLVPRLLEVFYCGICSRPASDASDTAWRYHSVILACMSSRFGASGHCHAEKRAMRLCCEQLVHSMSLRVSLGPRTQHGRDSCCPKTLIDDFGPFL